MQSLTTPFDHLNYDKLWKNWQLQPLLKTRLQTRHGTLSNINVPRRVCHCVWSRVFSQNSCLPCLKPRLKPRHAIFWDCKRGKKVFYESVQWNWTPASIQCAPAYLFTLTRTMGNQYMFVCHEHWSCCMHIWGCLNREEIVSISFWYGQFVSSSWLCSYCLP